MTNTAVPVSLFLLGSQMDLRSWWITDLPSAPLRTWVYISLGCYSPNATGVSEQSGYHFPLPAGWWRKNAGRSRRRARCNASSEVSVIVVEFPHRLDALRAVMVRPVHPLADRVGFHLLSVVRPEKRE